MLRYRLLLSVFAMVTVLTFVSCAKEVVETNEEIQARVLDSWINVKHPSSEKTSSGLYIIDFSEGTGRKLPTALMCLLNILLRSFQATFWQPMTKQFPNSWVNFPIQVIMATTSGVSTRLLSMQVWKKFLKNEGRRQGNRRIYTGTCHTFRDHIFSFSSLDGTAPLIFELELVDCVDDIYTDYEEPMLRLYSEKYWGGVDTIKRGFYFAKIKEVPAEDSIPTERR